MKVFNFTRIEYHEVERYYNTSISEDMIRFILAKTDIPEDQYPELILALEQPTHPRHQEIFSLVLVNEMTDDMWEFTEEISVSEEDATLEVDIALDSIDETDEIDDSLGTEHLSRTIH